MKTTVAIIGVGLIGGSLGQALRRSRRYRVLGIGRHRETLRLAKRRGAVDRISTHWPDVQAADMVVLSTPVNHIVPTLKKLSPFFRPGTIVTDVGSVKSPILAEVTRLKNLHSFFFVGGHPLAGSHQTGVAAANPDLFKGATCVLVPLDKAALKPVQALWKAVGARTLILSAAAHDRAVALISHLPHLVAYALVQLVACRRDRKTLSLLLAGSFRDVTRVASSDPDQWSQILRLNASNIHSASQEFQSTLDALEKKLSHSALRSTLQRLQAFRRPLFNGV